MAFSFRNSGKEARAIFLFTALGLVQLGCSIGSSLKVKKPTDKLSGLYTVALSQTAMTVTEGSSYSVDIVLSVAQNTSVEVSVALTSTTGSNRFQPLPATVTIPAGQLSVTLPLVPIDDSLVQAQQTWVLGIICLELGSEVTANELVITLNDNDGGTTPGAGTTLAGPTMLKEINLAPATVERIAMTDGRVLYAGTDATHGTELWVSDGTALGTKMLKDIYPGTISGNPNTFYLHAGRNLVFFKATTAAEGTELWVTDGTEAGTSLVKDLNSGTGSVSSLSFFNHIGDYVIFQVQTTAEGTEVWSSDGTTAGTQLLADATSGTASSTLAGFVHFNDALYFGVGKKNNELWKTDGTVAGTSLVYSMATNSNSWNPDCFLVWNDKLYFRGYSAGYGTELWQSDGTATGTTLLKDLNGTSTGTDACPVVSLSNGIILKALISGSPQLWFSDGTGTGTIYLKTTSFGGAQVTVVNDKAVFDAHDASGANLWVTNGTVAGTSMLQDLDPSSMDGFLSHVGVVNNKLVFTAKTLTEGEELWVTDGTSAGTGLLKDIYPGKKGSGSTDFKVIGNQIFFSALSASGRELWVTDGTSTGTKELVDLVPGVKGSMPKNLLATSTGDLFFTAFNESAEAATVHFSDTTSTGTRVISQAMVTTGDTYVSLVEMGGSVYFQSPENESGSSLWKTDGTSAGTVKWLDFSTTLTGLIGSVFSLNDDLLLFDGMTDAEGTEFWKTDGTVSGTEILKDIVPGTGSSVGSLPYIKGQSKLLFFPYSSTIGYEPWVTDGTSAGTEFLVDAITGSASYLPNSVGYNSTQDLFYFSTSYDDSIWVSDGTSVGTVNLTSAFSSTPGYNVVYFYTSGNKTYVLLYFAFENFPNGAAAIWVTDGTLAGTSRIEPVSGFKSAGLASRLVGGKLYFWANDGSSGIEMWASDGTSAGTIRLVDANSGAGGSVTSTNTVFTPFEDRVLFATTTPAAVWITDGTTAGTEQLLLGGLGIFQGQVLGSELFFTYDDGVHGKELWKTDGTSAGTELVKDINPGSASGYPKNHIVFNGKIYFSANDGVNGEEFWVTDGTTAGTFMLTDINPGPASSTPSGFKILNGKLYMQATKVLSGTEIWVMAP